MRPRFSDEPGSTRFLLADANLGALSVVVRLPDEACVELARLRITGPRVWMLFKDLYEGKVEAIVGRRVEEDIAAKFVADDLFKQEWEFYLRGGWRPSGGAREGGRKR